MTDKEILIDGIDVSGCEFQNECIEYKDISYLKIMPICAIHSLSIACHDKVNKCKYYKLYKQLKRLEAENTKLKNRLMILDEEAITVQITTEEFEEFKNLKNENAKLKGEINKLGKKHEDYCNIMYWQMKEQMDKYHFVLQKIKEIVEIDCKQCFEIDGFAKPDDCGICPYNQILQLINESESTNE